MYVSRLLPVFRATAFLLALLAAVPAWAQTAADPTTRLFAAAARGDMAAVRASLAAGGRADARNGDGLTPAEIAVDRGHYKVAHLLLAARKAPDGGQAPAFAIGEPPSEGGQAAPPPLQPMAARALPRPASEPSPFDPAIPLRHALSVAVPDGSPPAPAPAVASPPASGPAKTAEPTRTAQAQPVPDPGLLDQFFGKMTDFFTSGDPGALAPNGEAKPPSPMAQTRPASPVPTPALPVVKRALRIGAEGTLGRQAPPTEFGVRLPCLKKMRGTVLVCVETVTWPDAMIHHFAVESVLYRGFKMITRYNGGKAAFIHTLFPVQSHAAVVGYFTRLYGEPTETWTRTIAPLGEPRRGNPVLVWFGYDAAAKQPVYLEVRQYDDARADFPDTDHGAVLLHYEDATPIFPLISKIELMLIR